MTVVRTFLDDPLLYGADCDDTGAIILVYVWTLPKHLRTEIGQRVSYRLEYVDGTARTGIAVLESVMEDLATGATLMRLDASAVA